MVLVYMDCKLFLLIFRHNITVEFHLNEYVRAADMIEHAQNIAYTRGSTNTGEAIEHMFGEMFTSRNGDRSGIPNIGIIVTDGKMLVSSSHDLKY